MSEDAKEKVAEGETGKDSDYRENQADAQREWHSRNRDYWSEYRKRNPGYTERNRFRQRERNWRRRSRLGIAKMDELKAENVISSGRYRLVPLCNERIAKMDELIVEIGVVSKSCAMGVQGGP